MKIFKYFACLFLLLSLYSCSDDDEPSVDDKNATEVSRTILIYTIRPTGDSLLKYFDLDCDEILNGVKNAADKNARVLLYRYDNNTTCGLYCVKLKGKDPYFKLVKRYERTQTSTSPERINEVIMDALSIYPNSKYDMLFWGHGSSWTPKFTGHDLQTDGPKKAYGGEDNGKRENYIEIDELADAIPDHRFQTIWFDCCYMGGIEVIYQLRNKCDFLVAYPTEIYNPGMRYDMSLPYLMSPEHDLVAAAMTVAEFYESYIYPNYSVSVIDMSMLEPVADVAARVLKTGDLRPDKRTLLKYSRNNVSVPLIDLRQYLTGTATLNGNTPLAEEIADAIDNMVIFHAESQRDFYGYPWDLTKISGVSTSPFPSGITKEDNYYRTLDWYHRVY